MRDPTVDKMQVTSLNWCGGKVAVNLEVKIKNEHHHEDHPSVQKIDSFGMVKYINFAIRLCT